MSSYPTQGVAISEFTAEPIVLCQHFGSPPDAQSFMRGTDCLG